MRRFAFAALVSLGAVACDQNPAGPDAVGVSARKGGTITSPALMCSTQQQSVLSVIRRVEYLTSGEVRTALLAPVNPASEAVNPLACRPLEAITYLEQFQAAVRANEASIYPSVVIYFLTTTDSIIANLRTIV